MKSKLKNLLCISLVCLTIFGTACTKKESAPDKSADNKPTSTIASTDEIKESTGKPTNSATPESTAKPTATANNNTPSATPKTEKPTATTKPTTKPTATVAPKATPKPIDTNKYNEQYGHILLNSDYTEFALISTGEVYKVPKGMSSIDNWIISMYDEQNEQFFIQMMHYEENDYFGTLVGLYAFVQGEFYKLSEGKVLATSYQPDKNIFKWVEDNGLGKSVNVRSKMYNEVYIEVEGAKQVGSKGFKNFSGDIMTCKTENIKANIEKLG